MGFIKHFCFKKDVKKNAVGPAVFWRQFVGAIVAVSSDLSARIAEYFLQIIVPHKSFRIDLSGFGNGLSKGKLSRLYAEKVAIQKILFSEHFTICSNKVHYRLSSNGIKLTYELMLPTLINFVLWLIRMIWMVIFN